MLNKMSSAKSVTPICAKSNGTGATLKISKKLPLYTDYIKLQKFQIDDDLERR